MQVTGGGGGAGDEAAKARADYEAALKECDDKIGELKSEIAEAVKTTESAEMDELRRQSDEQRIGFELQMAGRHSVKTARALPDDHGGDVAALKEAESWLFEIGAPKQAGKTGLTNAGAASDKARR